jgi:type VI secretion system secreted protein VgrG
MSATATLLSLTSPAGDGALIPTRLVASERISALFRFEIDATGGITPIDPVSMLNKPASLALNHGGTTTRYFSGIVGEFGQTGPAGTLDIPYRLVLVPQLVETDLAADCRMFFNKSASDILKILFGEAGVTDVAFRLLSEASVRPAVAQYNETTLHFATRLMEEEGWFYFFVHSAGGHTLVVTDSNAGFDTVAVTLQHGGIDLADILADWRTPTALGPGQVSLADYDPNAPSKKLSGQKATVLKHAGTSSREMFHWPALTDNTSVIGDLAKRRMEAEEAQVALVHGAGASGLLFAGGKFNYQAPGGATVAYVVREILHEASDDRRRSGTGSESYANRFSAFPNAVPWRERMATARPRMEGVHTGIVLAPSGDEIHTDSQGRIKVRFFWDWRADATADSAPFIRVVQPWAGNGWGGQFIPRVNTEVAVAFIDADPDRPVVMGGLYNATSTPIFSADDKTKLGFRSRSSLNGGADAFNEFSFDDKMGSEMVLLHAQKDFTTEVENDETITVGKDRSDTVKGKETVTVTGDRSHTVSQGDELLTVSQGNRALVVSMGNDATTVKQGNQTVEIDLGNQTTTLKTGDHSLSLSTGNSAVEAKLGNISIKADVGSITIEALQGVTLKCGANSVALSPEGVTIKGMMVSVEGQMMTTVKGLMVETQGEAMLTLKGAITMIN